MNASPDLSAQVQHFAPLHPRTTSARNTPLGGVLLTNADLDHILGLFSLREGGAFSIYATTAVRAALEKGLGLQRALNCFCATTWIEPSLGDFVALSNAAGSASNLLYRAIELPGKPPPFAREIESARSGVHSVAYQFLNRRTGKRLLVSPDVAALNPAMEEALNASDAVLFDGTFWSSTELAAVRPGAKTAADMGHLTIEDGSLEVLSKLPAERKIYIHINNTNPILAPESAERSAVERAGITVGYDGLEFEL